MLEHRVAFPLEIWTLNLHIFCLAIRAGRRASPGRFRERRHSCGTRRLGRVAAVAPHNLELVRADRIHRARPPDEKPRRRSADKADWFPNLPAVRRKSQSRRATRLDE